MKIFILNYIIMINLFLVLIFLINLLLFEISFNPLNQLIYFIFFTIFMSINICLIKSLSLLLLYIILITIIRGIIILFSYFICLINLQTTIRNKFKFHYFIVYIFIVSIISIYIYKLKFFLLIKNLKIINNYNYSIITCTFSRQLSPSFIFGLTPVVMLTQLQHNTLGSSASPPAAARTSPGALIPRFPKTPISPLPTIRECERLVLVVKCMWMWVR